MARDLFNRYVWLVDTIKRYGRITRAQLDECWRRSPYSNGENLPRRTFYNYRQAVEELFDIIIDCDQSTFEYYIADNDAHSESVTDWLLNSLATSDVLSSSRDVASRIFLEDVPSARDHLSTVITALREKVAVRFDYQAFTRSMPSEGIVLEPYLLKIFRQRWYMTGRNVAENRVKTYALDRVVSLTLTQNHFDSDADFDVENYFRDAFGIVVDQGEPRRIALRTDPRQAKYFRALPLHHSQVEMIHDKYSIFYYRMRLTRDLVEELLSHGNTVTVLEPPELRSMIVQEMRDALANYDE